MELTKKEGKFLLTLARKSIESKLKDIELDYNLIDSVRIKEKRGCFVTINKKQNLRGCIGNIIPKDKLYQSIIENAKKAAFKDPRFPPLSLDEFGSISLEVSILTKPKKINFETTDDLLDKIEKGVDGIILKKGIKSSTYLPQVWNHFDNKEEFLSNLSIKAGLCRDGWKDNDINISKYQAQVFSE